ncbi:MAG: hypothetical protein OXH68_17065 [Gammaproteobacteria bacterium]|nr:hypothetical protein [Gammaproteobacteria bacterium]
MGVERHAAVLARRQPRPAGTLGTDVPAGVALHTKKRFDLLVGAFQEAQVAASELGLVVEGYADEGREAAECQVAFGILEERCLVGAHLGGVPPAEMVGSRRFPGIDLVRGRQGWRVPHSVDVGLPAVVRRRGLGLGIENRGEGALRRIVRPHGVAHDLAEAALVDEVGKRAVAGEIVVGPTNAFPRRMHINGAAGPEGQFPGYRFADDDETVGEEASFLLEGEFGGGHDLLTLSTSQ